VTALTRIGKLQVAVPAVLSPNKTFHDCLSASKGNNTKMNPFGECVLPFLHGKLGEDGAKCPMFLLELSASPKRGPAMSRVLLCEWNNPCLTSIAKKRGNPTTPNYWTFTAKEISIPNGLLIPSCV